MAGLAGAARRPAGVLAVASLLAAAGSSSDFRDAQTYVDAHNALRAAVQQPDGYRGGWKPIPPVAWSDELAGTAQEWAEHLRDSNDCKMAHSDTRFGENLAGGKNLDPARAVALWAKERDKYRWSPDYEFDTATGHYTQVVWRRVTHIGCGMATCGSRVVIACRYSPAGNHIGQAPY